MSLERTSIYMSVGRCRFHHLHPISNHLQITLPPSQGADSPQDINREASGIDAAVRCWDGETVERVNIVLWWRLRIGCDTHDGQSATVVKLQWRASGIEVVERHSLKANLDDLVDHGTVRAQEVLDGDVRNCELDVGFVQESHRYRCFRVHPCRDVVYRHIAAEGEASRRRVARGRDGEDLSHGNVERDDCERSS